MKKQRFIAVIALLLIMVMVATTVASALMM